MFSSIPRSSVCSRSRCLKSYAYSARVLARSSSTAAAGDAKYPFPAHRNPSPHQVFHLPKNASEADVKARYYDLVRLYHPDKATDIAPDLAHERFQVITHAYDVLRGKKASGSVDSEQAGPTVDLRYQTTAAWRTMHRKRTENLYKSGAADEKWKDRLIVVGVVGTIAFVLLNMVMTRRAVLDEAYRTQSSRAQRHRERVAMEEARLSSSRLEHQPDGEERKPGRIS
ncbi:hypothetical protein BKA70DRAFT_667006 [Coprinopsis sp. MPI-PUGE-AT-0042]|nr:hypothetical protein BKA70DRAFT_667006 [Coprinopsis sp. MPI-PUGE-AT-0042]